MQRLTREEMRIIEQTKREGAELQQREIEEGKVRKRSGLWSIVVFVLIFFLLAFGAKLLLGLISR